MWWNEELTIDAPVSARLLVNADEAMALLRSVYPTLERIGVSAPSQVLSQGEASTACLFSRGVDSWYSALTNLQKPDPRRPRLTHLVYVPSIDFMYSDENRGRSIAATRRAAEDVSCELVVLETNLRHFTERFQHFGITFGSVLSAIGLALGFSHVVLASSVPIGEPNRSGSHPALDPLWSTERTAIVHDGAETRRIDKARVLAEHREALTNLKVCFAADTERNCGRCDKCLITMIELHVAGVLDACPAFDRPLDPRAVARIRNPGWQAFFFSEAVDALGHGRLDIALRLALGTMLLRHELATEARRLRQLAKTRVEQVRARRRG
jgi:hypothetical protein